MKALTPFAYPFTILFLLLMIGGCGGGGDENDFSVSTQTIKFSGSRASPANAQQVTGTVSDSYNGEVYLYIEQTNDAIQEINGIDIDGRTGSATIVPKDIQQLSAGKHTDVIKIHACKDPNCDSELSGSPRTINVSYNVALDFDVPIAHHIEIDPKSDEAVGTIVIGFNGDSSGLSWSANASQPWITVRKSDSEENALEYNIKINDYLATGFLTNQVQINLSNNKHKIDPASFDVTILSDLDNDGIDDMVDSDRDGDGFSNDNEFARGSNQYNSSSVPTAISLSGDVSFLAAAVNIGNSDFDSRVLTIGSNNGAKIDWSAAVDVPWLKLDSSSGDSITNNKLKLQLVKSEVSTLANGDYTGTLHLVPSDLGIESVDVKISLAIRVPTIDYVSPYVGYISDSGKDYVVVRGSGFKDLNQTLYFGSTPVAATNVTVINDTTLRVVPPSSLIAGKYDIAFRDILWGADRTSATYTLMEHPNLIYASQPFYGIISKTIEDAERKAIIIVSGAQGIGLDVPSTSSIYRFAYTNGTLSQKVVGFAELMSADLTPDGQDLMVLTKRQILRVDPVTLETRQKIELPQAIVGGNPYFHVMNDGNILIPGAGFDRFNIKTTTFSSDSSTLGINSANASALSLDRNVIYYMIQDHKSQGGYRLARYEHDTGKKVVSDNDNYFSTISVDMHGTRASEYANIYDENINLVFSLSSGVFPAISPDGTRAYALDVNSAQFSGFDITGTTLPFPLIGNFGLTGGYSCCTRPITSLNGRNLIVAITGDSYPSQTTGRVAIMPLDKKYWNR